MERELGREVIQNGVEVRDRFLVPVKMIGEKFTSDQVSIDIAAEFDRSVVLLKREVIELQLLVDHAEL